MTLPPPGGSALSLAPSVFAVLHLADFALHAVLRTARAAPDRPHALFAGTGKKSVLLAATAIARAAGVAPGMTAPQAVARCPALVIHTPNPTAETEARAALLAVAFTLSPTIEDTAPGLCTVSLTGADPEKTLSAAHAAVATLADLALPAAAGLARTPLLALYAAQHLSLSSFSSSYSSDSSSNLSTPLQPPTERKRKEKDEKERYPVLVLPPESEKKFLAPLPLATADPSPALAAIFATWGVHTLGDLTDLPRDELVRRFGAEGLALWQRASGGEPRPLRPVVPPQTFSASLEFEDAIETLQPLLFLLRRFLDRLTLELAAAQHIAAELALTLHLVDATTHTRAFRLPEPTADPTILFRALHTHLESLHTAAAICAVRLRLTPARPLVRQPGLFDTGLRDPHGFADTLARIVALVGADRVGTPHLADTHRPDAVTLAPPSPVIPAPAPPPVHPPLSAPLRRFRPPLPARLEFTAGRPAYLWTDRLQGEISFRSVAWPGSGEWWQTDRAWARLEWDIALADGGLYRLLRLGDAWFLEGEYD